MKRKYWTIAAPAAMAVAISLFFVFRLYAQPQAAKPAPLVLSTNWVGCMVVGKDDALDRIARGPHPTTVRQVDIGLRSDGVVVWRGASGMK